MIIGAIIAAVIFIYFIGSRFVEPIILVTNHAIAMSNLDLTMKVPQKL